MAAAPDDAPRTRLSRWTLARVFGRSLFILAGFNPRTMQALGFSYALYPALARLYPDRAERRAAIERHLGLFNTHPYFAAAILGATTRVEERIAAGLAPARSATMFQDALAAPLAAIGDAFFWSALRPACALLAALTAPSLGLWSLLVFLGLYNAVHLPTRVWLFVAGYRRPAGLVQAIARVRFPAGTQLVKWAAAILAGAVAAEVALVAGRLAGPLWFAGAGAATLLTLLVSDRSGPYLVAYAALALPLAVALLLSLT